MAIRPDERGRLCADVADDSGLRCTRCEYNLTGLTEARCPECGAPFDVEVLRELLSGRPRPIPGWDDRPKSSVFTALVRACWWTWFRPAEFARRFPWTYHPASVSRFWFAARIAAVAPFAIGLVLMSSVAAATANAGGDAIVGALVAGLVVGVFVAAGSLACEVGLVLLLKLFVRPRFKPSSFSWWGFVACNGSFLVLSAYTCGLVFLIVTMTAHRDSGMLCAAIAFVCICWWWYAVGRGILVRSRPGFGRIAALALIPVIAAGPLWLFAVLPISCLSRITD
jgi:hypothetical protein